MYIYSLYEWLLIFYIYCFLGWIIESTIVSFEERRFVNRGFLKGPILPIYGTGATIVLVFCLPVKSNILLVFIVGMISATILEYITGYLMEKILKIKYWDYSKTKFNIKGRICLRSSLFWGILSVVLTLFINKPINDFILNLSSIILNIVTIIISCVFVVDFVYSFCIVMYFNKTMAFIEKVKSEIKAIQAEIENTKASTSNKAEYILGKRSKDLHKNYQELISKVNNFQKQLRKTYPKASSKHFNYIKELIDKVDIKRNKNNL